MSTIRTERIASLIKSEISDIISKVLQHDSIGFWTVTDVKVTSDLKLARIYISVYGDKVTRENSIRKIELMKKSIRSRLGSRLKLRFTPDIEFYLDDTLDRVDRINQLLKQIHNNDKFSADSDERKER
jgi:ribosome-binding factor A